MRAFSNALLAGLVVAALFWGNCFSCPQLLLSLAQQNAHGCCKRSAPAAQKCTTNVLKHFVKADPVQIAAPAVLPAVRVEAAPAPALSSAAAILPLHFPPGLVEPAVPLRI